MRAPLIFLACLACTASELPTITPEPTTTVDVNSPWTQVPAADGERAFRFADSPHGVRVALGPNNAFAGPGIALVTDGQTVGEPMLGVSPTVGPPTSLTISSEGYDLLVRYSSRPLSELSRDPDAPDDPALTWLRIRPRNGSWRLVLDGLGTLSVAADHVAVGDADTLRIVGSQGTFQLSTDAPATSTQKWPGHWVLDTSPSVRERAPYPRTGITWTP